MSKFNNEDLHFMRRAFDCARAVKGITAPNPAVGAVVVKGNTIIGEGATATCGGPHAEKSALAMAGGNAAGAVLYVTLEPCCHFGRTPPCTDAIIAAGIQRVVVAVRDPNPLVSGKGMRQLRKNGIEVALGCMKKEAVRINEDFMFAIRNERAFITLKLALTLDGYIADVSGKSRWITSEASRRIVHKLRREHGAVAVGSGTLEADDPMLDVRYGRKTTPARIVFSSGRPIGKTTRFYRTASAIRSIVVIRGDTRRHRSLDEASGIEYWFTGENDRQKSMDVFSRMAYENGFTAVLVEGGRGIASTVLAAGLVNRLYLFYGNKMLCGGVRGIDIGEGAHIENCIELGDKEINQVGEDFYITGIPVKPLR